MRHKLSLAGFLFIFIFSHCNLNEMELGSPWTKGKQMAPGNDSLIPDSIKNNLKEDAALLALRDAHADPESRQSLITIPQELIDFYYHGLIHIYNATILAARDSVFDIFNIHTFRKPEAHSIIIAVDSTKNWVQKWRMGQRLTENPQIDALMINYELQLINYYEWSFLHAVVLESPKPINIYALSKKFSTIDGIIFAEENRTVGDGNDISAVIEQEYLSIEFSKGWGDCPAGCIYRHYWLFSVKFDGTVQFVQSYGDAIP